MSYRLFYMAQSHGKVVHNAAKANGILRNKSLQQIIIMRCYAVSGCYILACYMLYSLTSCHGSFYRNIATLILPIYKTRYRLTFTIQIKDSVHLTCYTNTYYTRVTFINKIKYPFRFIHNNRNTLLGEYGAINVGVMWNRKNFHLSSIFKVDHRSAYRSSSDIDSNRQRPLIAL